MTNAIATEIRDRAEFMAVDEKGQVWLGGDGLKNAQNRADVERLIELGVLRTDFPCGRLRIYVNKGYEKFFERF